MMRKKIKRIQFLIFLILIAAIIYSLTELEIVKHYLANPDLLQKLVLSFGILAPIAVILLQTFQTTISIIPSQITTIIAGFIFGPVLGLVYSLIGAFLGSTLTFSIARKYGKKLELKLFDKKEIAHFNHFFKHKKNWALFLARMAPIFPNDLVSFAAGVTDVKFRDFTIVSTLGFLIQMIILTYFGSELSSGVISLPLIIISIIVSLMFIIVVFKQQIKKIVIQDFHLIEKEIEKEVKKEIKILT